MNRNYIIFFWIICLIIFTFYCVFRLKYLSDNSNSNLNSNINKILKEKYDSTSNTVRFLGNPLINPNLTEYTGDVLVTIPALTTVPLIKPVSDIMTYIKNVQSADKITDMTNCADLYDDNFKVQELGYKNCSDAYSDYLAKNFDLNNKYGNTNTLAEICPIASKTSAYSKCLQLLLTKFSDNVNLLDGINIDMSSSINSRLAVRTNDLYKIQSSLSPFLYSKVQNDFNNNMLMKGQTAQRSDDKLNLINKYYQNKYQTGIETFTNISLNTVKDIESLFFGQYKPVRGQFTHLADLIFTIEYDDSVDYILPTPIDKQSSTQSSTQSSILSDTQSSNLPDTQTSTLLSQPTTLSSLSPQSIQQNTRHVIFTLSNNDIYITYTVSSIDYYDKSKKNAIKLILTAKNIVYQLSPTNIIEPLLQHLGLYAPSSINIVFDKYTSTEKQAHNTYRLVNDNLDTILVLEKAPTPQPTKTPLVPL